MDPITVDEAHALLLLLGKKDQYSVRFTVIHMLTESQRKVFKRAVNKPWIRGWNWFDIYASALAHASQLQEVKRETEAN